MSYLPPLPLAFQLELLSQARHAAWIIDPDVGGAETFIAERTRTINGQEYVYAEVPLEPEYDVLIRSKNAGYWHGALNALATARNRDPISLEDCAALCAGCLLGEEIPQDEL